MEFKKIKFIYPIDDFQIIAFFTDGKKKIFDVKLLINKYKPFKAFETNPELFFSARIAPGGYAIVWNDDLDISADSVYYDGQTYDVKKENSKILKDLKKYIKSIRKEEKVSQKLLSELSGIPQPAIARIESGTSDPQISTLSRLLAPLGYELQIVKVRK